MISLLHKIYITADIGCELLSKKKETDFKTYTVVYYFFLFVFILYIKCKSKCLNWLYFLYDFFFSFFPFLLTQERSIN